MFLISITIIISIIIMIIIILSILLLIRKANRQNMLDVETTANFPDSHLACLGRAPSLPMFTFRIGRGRREKDQDQGFRIFGKRGAHNLQNSIQRGKQRQPALNHDAATAQFREKRAIHKATFKRQTASIYR